ncbi:MAG: hypothetical protein Q8P67_04795 [archaeon]|nr:hypothetical protein [archaeon]
MVLCFGDGFADLLGRRFGRNYPLPWNRSKSVVGSAAFFLSALGGSLWMCRWFASLGFLHAPSPSSLAAVTLAATFVESLPIPDWDNLTVFLSVLFASNFVPL